MTDQVVTTNWSFENVKNYVCLSNSRLDRVMKENKQLYDKVQKLENEMDRINQLRNG